MPMGTVATDTSTATAVTAAAAAAMAPLSCLTRPGLRPRVPPAARAGWWALPPCDAELECVPVSVGAAEYRICTATSPAGGRLAGWRARAAPRAACVPSRRRPPRRPACASWSLCDGASAALCIRGFDACAGGAPRRGCAAPRRWGTPCEVGTPTGEAVCGPRSAYVRPGPGRHGRVGGGAVAVGRRATTPPPGFVAVQAAGGACVARGLAACVAASTGGAWQPPEAVSRRRRGPS